MITYTMLIEGLANEPLKSLKLSLFWEIVNEEVERKIGYEAGLADMSFTPELFEDVGINLKFSGYNEKMNFFVKEVL